MISALHPDRTLGVIKARDAERGTSGYSCPDCSRVVILKKGRVRTPHFAHKPPVTCSRGRGETPVHRACKEAIWLALSAFANIQDLDVERRMGSIRPDISFRIGRQWVGIEVQRSPMTREEIVRRMTQYANHGIAVLWLRPEKPPQNGSRYRPRDWHRWLHAAYYGRAYYWSGAGAFVQPVHFAAWRSWVKAADYYDPNIVGCEVSRGGYHRRLKADRKILWGPTACIGEDFAVQHRDAFQMKSMSLPAARLFIDRSRSWWPVKKKSGRLTYGR